MFRILVITAAVVLAGCETPKTEDGCPRLISEEGRAYTEACIAAYYAEKARLQGRAVTTCRTVGNTTTCTSD